MADTNFVKNIQAGRRKRHGQRGSVAVTSILFLTLIIGGSLGAIDLARHNIAQQRLSNALDAAVISAGRNLGNFTPRDHEYVDDQWVKDAHDFFYANMPESFLGARFPEDALTINYEEIRSEGDVRHRIGQQISMSAHANLPLISTGYLGVTSMKLGAANQALRRNRSDLEVVLVMDNSGSMDTRDKGSSKTRMAHLKDASNLLVDMVLGAAEANENTRTFIGLVPFTHVVNVGNSAITQAWLTPGTPSWRASYFVKDVWKGCITEPRPGGLPLADVAGTGNGPGNFRPLYHDRSSNLSVSHAPNSNANKLEATFTPDKEGYWRPNRMDQPGGPYKVPTRRNDRSLTLYYLTNPGMCNDSLRVRFLTDQSEELNNSIDSMYSEGGTAVPAGLLWGWRMLHPTWSGHWGGRKVALEDGGSAAMPRPPHRDLTKVLILLTDGANSVAGGITTDEGFTYSVSYHDSGGTKRTLNDRTIGHEQRVSNHLINNHNSLNDTAAELTPDGGDSTARLDAFTRQLCNNIKNPDDTYVPGGIKIYTIALGPASDAGLMRDCASPNGFYNASNVNNLTSAFASIAGDLMELRLTK